MIDWTDHEIAHELRYQRRKAAASDMGTTWCQCRTEGCRDGCIGDSYCVGCLEREVERRATEGGGA